jgi:hypothetical protein
MRSPRNRSGRGVRNDYPRDLARQLIAPRVLIIGHTRSSSGAPTLLGGENRLACVHP